MADAAVRIPTTIARYDSRCPGLGCGGRISVGSTIYRVSGRWVCVLCLEASEGDAEAEIWIDAQHGDPVPPEELELRRIARERDLMEYEDLERGEKALAEERAMQRMEGEADRAQTKRENEAKAAWKILREGR